jgi:hypothetical protein
MAVPRDRSRDVLLPQLVEVVDAPLQLAQRVDGGLAVALDLAIRLAILLVGLSRGHACDFPEPLRETPMWARWAKWSAPPDPGNQAG